MYFNLLFIIVVSIKGFKLYLEKEQNISIVQDDQINIRFNQESLNQTQCHPSKLYMFNYNEEYSKFIFKNTLNNEIEINITPFNYDIELMDIKLPKLNKNFKIQSNQEQQYIINYECQQQIIDKISWSLIIFNFKVIFDQNNSKQYEIYFYKQCKQTDQYIHPLIVLLILAITLIIIGSNFGLQEIKQLEQIKTEEFDSKTSILFILSASLLLFSLYKFPQIGQIILSIIFFFMSIISIQIIFEDLLQKFIQQKLFIKIISYLFGICLVSLYFYTKHWILNNILAFIIVLLMFKIIEIDSMKTACLLLSLAFFYDIFWVFISPIFFGTSVMAQVATTIDLPIKFICPSLIQSLNSPLMKCSLLGLGDILLPGIVIKYILKFETLINKGLILYIISIIGYSLGLLICMLSLIIYQHAQPALLYLVPFILIPIIIISIIKQQFYQLWKGQIFKQQKQGVVYELQQSEQV